MFSLSWALATLTTVGYGDITAYTIEERTLALIWMVVGVGFYSFNIGNLSAMISTIDFKAAQLQNKLQMIQDFVRRTQLPTEIEQQIKNYIENNHKVDLEQTEQKKLLA